MTGPPKAYRALPDGTVEQAVFCVAPGHLARVGEPTWLGVTRGSIRLDDFPAVCPTCQAAWAALPPLLRPPEPSQC